MFTPSHVVRLRTSVIALRRDMLLRSEDAFYALRRSLNHRGPLLLHIVQHVTLHVVLRSGTYL